MSPAGGKFSQNSLLNDVPSLIQLICILAENIPYSGQL